MTKLEQLIKELCPNGVEYKKLCDIAIYSKSRISSQDVDENSYVGVDNLLSDRGGKTTSNCVPEEGSLTCFDIGDILIGNIRPYLKKIWLADIKGGTNGDVLVIHIIASGIVPKYLYYALSSDKFFLYNMKYSKGAKMPRGDKEAIMKYEIPIPPIEIQEEVVTLLDDYTIKNAELCNSLEQELSARKKQYEYYRDLLLDFGVHGGGASECEWRTLGEISKYRRGSFPQPYGNKEWYDGEGAMPFVQVADIMDNMCLVPDTNRKISLKAQPKSVFAPKGSIIISLQGSIGRIAVTQYDAYIDRTIAIFTEISDNILSKYFVYQLQRVFSIKEKTARGSTIKTITKEEFTSFPVPIPSIKEQKRIVSILDRFDKLCNDISEGLPAEIKARRKQYEYYRDKLLSFEEICNGT